MHERAIGCGGDNRTTAFTDRDRKMLREIYGPFDQVSVIITNPPPDAVIFPDRSLTLSAATGSRATASEHNSKLAADNERSEHSLRWTSDDTELGVGEEITIETDLILPGVREIVAEAVDGDGRRLGSDSVSVRMITEVVTSEGSVFHPIPCIELAGDPDGKCLLVIREDWRAGNCQIANYRSEITLKELESDREFPVIVADFFQSPFGAGCEDNQNFPLFDYAWPYSTENPMHLRFVHTNFRNSQLNAQNSVTGPVHHVRPVLGRLEFPLACHLDSGQSACGIELHWDRLFFAPGAAVFSRDSGESDWRKELSLGVATGTLELSAGSAVDYRDFAIFQYGDDVRIPDSSNPLIIHDGLRTVIPAPAGQLAFDVRARAVPPVDSRALPISGHWRNPDRPGGGLFISRNIFDQYLLIWLTYDQGGTPRWFLSDAVPIEAGLIESELFRASFDQSSSQVSVEAVGEVRFSLASSVEAVFAWELQGSSGIESFGSERMKLLHGGSSGTGLWSSESPRWSVAVSVAGTGAESTGISSSLFYADGQPVWAQGIFAGSPFSEQVLDADFFDGKGLCPGCIGSPMSLAHQDVGLVGIALGSEVIFADRFGGPPDPDFAGDNLLLQPRGWIDVETPDGQVLVLGDPSSPLQLRRLTIRQAFTR